MQRSNLSILTGAQTTRILFEGSRAVGVTYVRNGQTCEARASREIVLCGGAINSPQLLLLSGVGPAAALRELEIPVILDAPGVGQNLQDHLAVFVAYRCTAPISLSNAATPAALLSYRHFGRGPLSSNVGEAGAFMRLRPDRALPDLQFHFAPGWFLEHGFVQPEGHGLTLAPTMLLPESRGYLALRSADPFAAPMIQPNYLQREADMQTLVEGVKLARALSASTAFAPFVAEELEPGDQVQSDDSIRAWIRAKVETLYHPVGTCKMGADAMAVVDPELRVQGIQGLRVADASIMPFIPNGNTNAPTIMIGEKAAAMIQAGNG